MNKKTKRLLIIPAKSVSTRIKNKNFKKFFGKSIILYSYESGIKSNIFDKIHVSTESNRIKKKLNKMKIKVDFLRKKSLANKNVGLFEVYKYVYKEYKKKGQIFDEIWSLLPCSPLIQTSDLTKLKNKILKKKIKKPIISVCRYPAPIEWAFRMTKKKVLKPINFTNHKIASQKFEKSYFEVGVLSVFDSKDFERFNSKNIFNKFSGYELKFHKSIDIDDHEDWKFAEKLFEK